MDQRTFTARMDQLAAAYRVELSPKTRAAYWLAFQKGTDHTFATLIEKAIDSLKDLPSVAELKEIGRQMHAARPPVPALAATSGTVMCPTCMDAGFVKRDAAVNHPDFGREIVCPACNGAAMAGRNNPATVAAMLEREHALFERERARLGLPPLGATLSGRPTPAADAPPEGFASPKPDLVPNTAREDRMQAARAQMHRQIAAIAGKMWGGA